MLAIFKEVLDYGQTKKAVRDARCPSGTDFVRIVPCGAGAAQFMFERVPAGPYERGEGLSRRSDMPSRRTCGSSGLRPGLYLTTVIADAVTQWTRSRITTAGYVLPGNGFSELGFARGDAAIEEAAGGEELGVEEGGAGGAADEVVGEQGQLDVEKGTFADAADDGGHAVSGVEVAPGLRAVFFLEEDDGIPHGGGERGQLGVHFKIAQGFADFAERSDFFQADGDAFEVAVYHRHAVAVGAEAEAGIHEA